MFLTTNRGQNIPLPTPLPPPPHPRPMPSSPSFSFPSPLFQSLSSHVGDFVSLFPFHPPTSTPSTTNSSPPLSPPPPQFLHTGTPLPSPLPPPPSPSSTFDYIQSIWVYYLNMILAPKSKEWGFLSNQPPPTLSSLFPPLPSLPPPPLLHLPPLPPPPLLRSLSPLLPLLPSPLLLPSLSPSLPTPPQHRGHLSKDCFLNSKFQEILTLLKHQGPP